MWPPRASLGSQAVTVFSLAALMTVTVFAATFFEDFSAMPVGECYPDGTTIGAWQSVYNGYGCNAFVAPAGNTRLFEQPLAAASPSETHSALVTGPSVSGDFALQLSAATTRQLRLNTPANPWEVAWVLWHYADHSHFYYFVAKPNGWELGKADPAYPGAQRFLATGDSPSFPIGAWYRIAIAQSGESIQVFVNDLLITAFADRERPYVSGRVGLYSEDAEVNFDNVALMTGGKGRKRR